MLTHALLCCAPLLQSAEPFVAPPPHATRESAERRRELASGLLRPELRWQPDASGQSGSFSGGGFAPLFFNDFPRVLPLGDSNTQGAQVWSDGVAQTGEHKGGYRAPLHASIWTQLGAFANFGGKHSSDFADGDSIIDHDHEGYGGARIDQITDGFDFWDPNGLTTFPIEERMDGWRPSLVLLTAGTNDITQDYQLEPGPGQPGLLERYVDLIDRILAAGPQTMLLVGATIPRNAGLALEQTEQLNADLQPLVEARQAAGERIRWVDTFTPLLPWVPGDLTGVHPDGVGYFAMANAFFGAVQNVWGELQLPEQGPGGSLKMLELVAALGANPFELSPGALNAADSPALRLVAASNFPGTGDPEVHLNDGSGLTSIQTDVAIDPWTLTTGFNIGDVAPDGYDITQLQFYAWAGTERSISFELEIETVDVPGDFVSLGRFHTIPVLWEQPGCGAVIYDLGGTIAERVRSVRLRFYQSPVRLRTTVNELGIYGAPSSPR
ncbi:MAG: GDSL-type esterase/lipase family protein [Planctomycetota bacterium]|jgi:hypothetical protein